MRVYYRRVFIPVIPNRVKGALIVAWAITLIIGFPSTIFGANLSGGGANLAAWIVLWIGVSLLIMMVILTCLFVIVKIIESEISDIYTFRLDMITPRQDIKYIL